MGLACGMYGVKERFVQGFGGENVRERDPLKDLGIDGREMDLPNIDTKNPNIEKLLAWTRLTWVRVGVAGGVL